MVCLFFTQKYPAFTGGVFYTLPFIFLCLDFNFHQAVAAFDTAAGRYMDL